MLKQSHHTPAAHLRQRIHMVGVVESSKLKLPPDIRPLLFCSSCLGN